MPARGCQQDGDPKRRSVSGHRVLGEQRHARQRAEEQPPARIAAPFDLDQSGAQPQPQHQLDAVHRVEPEEHLQQRRGDDCGARDCLPVSRGAESTGNPPGEQDHQRATGRRRHPQRDYRIAEDRQRAAQHEGRKRWMIHVAPRQALGARDVVQLVDEDAKGAGDTRHEVQQPGQAGGDERDAQRMLLVGTGIVALRCTDASACVLYL